MSLRENPHFSKNVCSYNSITSISDYRYCIDNNITVDEVNLEKFMGKWYEISCIPSWFESQCKNVCAIYEIKAKNDFKSNEKIRVKVINQCSIKGKITSIEGTARVIDTKTCSKLQVTFFPSFIPWFFTSGNVNGNYWILNLDQDAYSWVMVGNPSKTALWIMSRKPYLEFGIYNYLISEAVKKGFDTSKLVFTSQDENYNTYFI